MRHLAAAIAAVVLLATPAVAHDGCPECSTWPEYRAHYLEKHEPLTERQIATQAPDLLEQAWDAWKEADEAWDLAHQPVVSSPTSTTQPTEVAGTLFVSGPYAIPTYIVMCESGGNYRAENPVSTASGAYQITDGTWAGYGGYSHASYAPPAVQDAKAAQLWAGGAGSFHWANCL